MKQVPKNDKVPKYEKSPPPKKMKEVPKNIFRKLIPRS
jgi:hypothetical protein